MTVHMQIDVVKIDLGIASIHHRHHIDSAASNSHRHRIPITTIHSQYHNNVVWSGQNEFCDMCYATRTFIHLYMPDDCAQRRRNIEVLGKYARWIKTIDMVDDILENPEEVD